MKTTPKRAASRARGPAAPVPVGRMTLRLTVNGRGARVSVPPMKRLLDVLRDDLALTGSKEGCGEGECGACSVLLDGALVNACLVPAVQCDGREVITVEGLARGLALGPLQRSFVEHGAAQCGICTPGMLMAAHALVVREVGRVPGDPEVREALAGNLCRCTGYQRIVDAVRAAAREAAAARERPVAKRKRATVASRTRGDATRKTATVTPRTRPVARRKRATVAARKRPVTKPRRSPR